MLKKHEQCGPFSRKRNLVLPKNTSLQTFFLALIFLGSGLIYPLSAKQLPSQEAPITLEMAQLPMKGTLHTTSFQLKKPLDQGSTLSISEMDVRLHTGEVDFNAVVQGDGQTVQVIINGTSVLPDADWAMIQVIDAGNQVTESYIVSTDGGIITIADLEH